MQNPSTGLSNTPLPSPERKKKTGKQEVPPSAEKDIILPLSRKQSEEIEMSLKPENKEKLKQVREETHNALSSLEEEFERGQAT